MPKKVLFISHEASRTGAPIVFLNFLKWFKANTDIPFQILLKKGGVLEPDFKAIAPVLLYPQEQQEEQGRLSSQIISRIKKKLGVKKFLLRTLKKK